MAITITGRGSGLANYGSPDPYTGSDTFTASAGDIVVVCVMSLNGSTTISSVTSHGQNLTQIHRVSGTALVEAWAGILTGTPGSGSVSVDHSGTYTQAAITVHLTGDFSGHSTINDAITDDVTNGGQYQPSSEWQIGTLDGSGSVTISMANIESGGLTYSTPTGWDGNISASNGNLAWVESTDTSPTVAFTGSVNYKTIYGIALAVGESTGGGISIPVVMNHLRNQGIS